MLSSAIRIFQRYLIPRFVVSVYFFLKYRCFISHLAKVQFTRNITFGKGTVVKAYALIQTNKGKISIGKNCAISSFNHISTNKARITIGDNVRIASNVVILGVTRNFMDKSRLIINQGHTDGSLTIGNDVFIGAGAIILKGINIGEGAVVGPGALVQKDVPPYSIVFGVPARVVWKRS